MVEATNNTQGDGLARNVMYAKFRTDKPADPGYSAELVNVDTPAEVLDNMDSLPEYQKEYSTILECFLQTVKRKGDDPFMGTRCRNPDGSFGEYVWQSWAEIH